MNTQSVLVFSLPALSVITARAVNYSVHSVCDLPPVSHAEALRKDGRNMEVKSDVYQHDTVSMHTQSVLLAAMGRFYSLYLFYTYE